MSTEWGLYCESCDVESYHWFNHGEALLREVIAKWPQIREMNWNSQYIEVQLQYGPSSEVFEFLEAHYTHRSILLKNEYGKTAPAVLPSPHDGSEPAGSATG